MDSGLKNLPQPLAWEDGTHQNIGWMSVHKPRPLKPRIGEMLLSEGRISEATLNRALDLQNRDGRGRRLGAILLKWDLLAETDLLEALSRFHRCPAADRETLAAADKKAVALLSPEQANRLNAMPYAFEDKAVRVAFADPSNLDAVDEVKAITGKKILPSVTSEVRLAQAQQRFYARTVAIDLWSVVQKLERKRLKMPPPVSEVSPEPPKLPGTGGEPDPRVLESVATGDPGGAASAEGVESSSTAERVEELSEPVEAYETVGVGKTGVAGEQSLDRTRELNPFSDDPLAKFVEDALSFFSRDKDLAVVFQTLEEPVEELDPSTEQVRDAPAPRGVATDSTMPRSRRSDPGLSY
jgi:hypothetical protein